jgi:hypothetical protein
VVSLAVDGKPLPAERVAVGARNSARKLNSARFELEAIEGIPTRLKFGWRDQPITAFLWRIPAGERIEDEDLPRETRESLEALGYIE